MKRFFTLSFYMLITGFAFGQITITADEVPIPSVPYNMDDVTGFIPNPIPTADFTWDYGTIEGNAPFTVTYYEETLQAFVDAGIDVFLPGFKSLTSQLGYNTDAEIDFNMDAVEDKGGYVSYQAYPLSALTGNPNDSIFFPEQGWLWGSPKVIMKFPFTYQDSWSSISGRQTNFQITVTQAGLNKANAMHIYYIVRHDTIAGYGKMRLYTENGPSQYYDVLVDQISEFAVDSFYLNGAPAPSFILTPFGMSQGQITDGRNRLNVYREGSFIYLFSTFYGPNDHGTTPLGEFINTDNLVTSTSNPNNE